MQNHNLWEPHLFYIYLLIGKPFSFLESLAWLSFSYPNFFAVHTLWILFIMFKYHKHKKHLQIIWNKKHILTTDAKETT